MLWPHWVNTGEKGATSKESTPEGDADSGSLELEYLGKCEAV
jgi:hypothetical protein